MIVVTTPTGNIGKQVIEHLLDSGESIRVIARDPSRLSSPTRERVEVVQGSHGDIDVVNHAFMDADTVFWVLPPNFQAASVEAAYVDFTRPACEAFNNQGVKRVVGVSALGRGWPKHVGLVSASLAMDDLIASTGVNYRALTMLVHGQHPQPDRFDQEPGYVLLTDLRGPQGSDLRHPRHRHHRR